MQLINDFKGISQAKNVFTIEASYVQNGIKVPHHFVVTCKPIAAGAELLL